VYPPLLLWLDAPLSLLPYDAARIAWSLLELGALTAALRLLGLRDWRCYGLALFCVPVVSGLAMGNVSLVLVLGLAAVWRLRDRSIAAGVTVGLLVAVKLLFWPLLVWLVATRRFRSAAVAVAVGPLAVLAAWSAIAFKGLADYLDLLHIVGGRTAGPRAANIWALAHQAGLSDALARGLQYACALAVLGAACALARRTDGDRRAFSAVIVAAIVASPVVWLHYFVFLLVPIALTARRLGPAWRIPAAFWAVVLLPGNHLFFEREPGHGEVLIGSGPSTARVGLFLALAAATLAITAVRPPRTLAGHAPARESRRPPRLSPAGKEARLRGTGVA
jgi:hypothetical protein